MAVLSGCGGGSDSPATPPAQANTAPVIVVMLSGNVDPGTGGADVSASAGSVLTLNASGSTDAEGDALAYKWTIVSKPAASNMALVSESAIQQTFKPEVSGTYVISLRVTDSKGAFAEKKATILIRDNSAPVTSLAVTVTYTGEVTTRPNQSVNIGSTIVLDASKSTDADGDLVTTTWTLIQKPASSAASLTTETATTRFVTDVAGLYKVRARGTDPLGAYSDTVYVFESNNSAPKALVLTSVSDAPGSSGKNALYAAVGYTVSLNAANSQDPDGSWLSYTWTLVKPAGSQAELSSTDGVTTQIDPDLLGNYVVKLVATNHWGVASTYTTTIVVGNRRPVAAITTNVSPTALPTGPAIRLPVNTLVTLRGSTSVDADGDVLTYGWTLSGKPTGSVAAVSSDSGAVVQMTVDLAGSYTALLRVTDSTGAYSEQTMKIEVGNYAPVAVIDRSRITVLSGTAATASAALSFDEDRDNLTYAWAIDARPVASTATIAAASSATLSFTPDLPGTYVASVTVSDGISSNVSYVTINSLASFAATVSLPFAPLETRYSRGLDKLVILATNPNALKIVDPFTGLIKTVILPAGATAMSLSPNGKLAVLLHDSAVSLVDLETATLVRSSTSSGSHSDAQVSNAGIVYLNGTVTSYSDAFVSVINGHTGANLTTSFGMAGSSYYNLRGVFAGSKGRVLSVMSNQSSYDIKYFDIDAVTGKVTRSGSLNSSGNGFGTQLFLSENDDLAFTNAGTYFRTDTVQYAGKLAYTGNMHSLSHSSAAEETLVMLSTQGDWPDYATNYSANYKRYVGALFLADTDLTLPTIGGAQSYGINIFHSANGKHIALVQTGSRAKLGTGISYYVLAR
ncbi:MAG: PKD domain-containing protein [Pseudomonadota bacterium]